MGKVTANPMPRSGLVVRWSDQQATAFVSPQGNSVPSPLPAGDPGDEALREQFAESLAAEQAAAFEEFKARGGAVSYKAASVKVAAEKLAVLDEILAAIDGLVSVAVDKSLLLWWDETDTISRGDEQWREIEAAVTWTDVQPQDIFDMAAGI